MQSYSKELYELLASGAFKIQIWKEGYPFTADGLRQAQDDLGEIFSVDGGNVKPTDRRLKMEQ